MAIEKFNFGLVGLGWFGKYHADVLTGLPQVSLTAVCDLRKDLVSEFGEKYQVKYRYTDYRELMENPEIQVVDVVTTEESHYEVASEALKRGKHVFIEKPITTKVSDAEALVSLAKKSSLIMMVGHILRFDVRYAYLKEEIDKGNLGELIHIYCRRNSMSSWFGQWVRLNTFINTAIHDIDLILWYTRDKVERVYAEQRHFRKIGNPDVGCAILSMSKGTTCIIENIWHLPDKMPFRFSHDYKLEVIGSKAAAEISAQPALSLWTEDGAICPELFYWPRLHGNIVGALSEELRHFVHCLLTGKQSDIIKPEESVEALRVAYALVESAETGKIVEVKN
ncbi:MAG: Gfo/Idh/MocA family protein [Candidatus Bathyarchaeia archaeon]